MGRDRKAPHCAKQASRLSCPRPSTAAAATGQKSCLHVSHLDWGFWARGSSFFPQSGEGASLRSRQRVSVMGSQAVLLFLPYTTPPPCHPGLLGPAPPLTTADGTPAMVAVKLSMEGLVINPPGVFCYVTPPKCILGSFSKVSASRRTGPHRWIHVISPLPTLGGWWGFVGTRHLGTPPPKSNLDFFGSL